MIALMSWINPIVFVLSLTLNIAITIIIVRNLLPDFLSGNVQIKNIASLVFGVVIMIVAIQYIPSLLADAFQYSYDLSMPKYMALGTQIRQDLQQSQYGNIEFEVHETDYFELPTAPGFESPLQTATPVPTLDMTLWNLATPPPTPPP